MIKDEYILHKSIPNASVPVVLILSARPNDYPHRHPKCDKVLIKMSCAPHQIQIYSRCSAIALIKKRFILVVGEVVLVVGVEPSSAGTFVLKGPPYTRLDN